VPTDEDHAIEDLEDKEPVEQQAAEEEGDLDDNVELVEVVFKGNRRAIYYNSHKIPVAWGDYVIVEADKGVDLGRVGTIGDSLRAKRKAIKRKEVIRQADERELRRWRQLRPREEDAHRDFQQRVTRRTMPMKPVDVEYQLDGKKVCFYFTADHRVDFRELVRELAGVYRTRIELRQIGVRDEAKRLGGLGPCGRELCCATFLTDFAPITSQMARDQNLALNPSKLSGLCGRLKCCLRFEYPFYHGAKERFPKLGTHLAINGREGKVSKLDFFQETITLRFEGGDELALPVGSFKQEDVRPAPHETHPSGHEARPAPHSPQR